LNDDRKREEAKRTSDDLTEKIQSAAEIKAELERVVDELSKSSQGDGVRKLVEEAIGRVKNGGKSSTSSTTTATATIQSSSKDQTTLGFELPSAAPRRAHRVRQRGRVAKRAVQRRAQRVRARRSVAARERAQLAQAKRAGSYHKALEEVGERRISELKEESATLIKRIEQTISDRVEEIQAEADKEGTEDAKRKAEASIRRLHEEGAERVKLVESKTTSRIQLLEQAMSPSASLGQGENTNTNANANDDDKKVDDEHGGADDTAEQRAAREAREAEAAQRHLDALRQRENEEEREMLQANDELAAERREARKEIAAAELEEEREARQEQRATEQKAEREAQDAKDAEIALEQAQAQADRVRERATTANENVQESKQEVHDAESKVTDEQRQADEAAKKLEEEKREAEREIIEAKRKEEQEARQEERAAEREVEREREDAENFRQQVEVAQREAETAQMQAKRAEDAEKRAAEERAETERKAEERREKHEEEHELEVAERAAETEEEQRHRQAMRNIEAGRLDQVDDVNSSSKQDDDDDKGDKYDSDLLAKIDESLKAMEHKFDSLDDEMKGIENKMNQYPATRDDDDSSYPAFDDADDDDDDKYPTEEQYDDSYTTLPDDDDDEDEDDFDEDAEGRAEMLQERVEDLLRQLEAAQAKNDDHEYPKSNDGYSSGRYFDDDFFRRRPIGLEPDFETTDPSQESGLMYACPSRNTCMTGASLFVRNNELVGMRGECEDGSSATDLRSSSFSLFPEFTNIDPTVDPACFVQFSEDFRSVWIRREDAYVIAMSSDGTAATRCGRDVAAAASVRYECQNPLACITGFHVKNEYGNLDQGKARTPNDLAISEVDFVCSDGTFAVDPNTLRRDYGQVRVEPFFETGVAETPQEDGSTRRTLTPFLKLKTDTVVSSSFLMAIRVRDITDVPAAEQEGWCNQQTEQAHLNAFHTCKKGSKLCSKTKFLYNPDGSEYELKMGEQVFSVLAMDSHESSRIVIGNEDMTDAHHVKSFPIAPNEEFFKFGRKYQVCASAVERTKFKTEVKDKATGAVTDTFFNRHLDGSAKFIGLKKSGERSISMEGGPRHFDVETPAAPSEDEVANLHCFGCAVSGGVHAANVNVNNAPDAATTTTSSYPKKQQQYPKQQPTQYPKQQPSASPSYPQQAATVEEKLQNMVIKKDLLPKYPTATTTEQQQQYPKPQQYPQQQQQYPKPQQYPQQQQPTQPQQYPQQQQPTQPQQYPQQQQPTQPQQYPQQQQQANYPAQQKRQDNYPAQQQQQQQQQDNYPAQQQQQQQQPDAAAASLAKEAKEEALSSLRERLAAMLHRH
jgi:epidermal growth factor receptor substrate 15